MTPGPLELGIVLLIALLIFGPKKLPGLGKQLGTGMREFKDGITGKASDAADEEPAPMALPQAPEATSPAAAPTPAAVEDPARPDA